MKIIYTKSQFKLAQNPKLIAFQIIMMMDAWHKPQTHVRNLSYTGQVGCVFPPINTDLQQQRYSSAEIGEGDQL